MRPSSSRDDDNRRQGQDFLGHRLQSQGSPSENFGESRRTGNEGTSKSPTKPPDERTMTKTWQQEQRPPKNSGGETRAAHSNKRFRSNPQEWTPLDCPDRKRLRSQRKQISKVFGIHLVKIKMPNRAEASRARRRENFMGGVSTLPNNPEKGRAVNRKTKNSYRLRDVLNEDRKLNGCMALDGPQKSFIK